MRNLCRATDSRPPTRRRASVAALLVAAMALPGCQPPLMPTPCLYHNGKIDPFASTPEALKSPFVDLLFITDRTEAPASADEPFTSERSDALQYGVYRVRLGKDADWATLAAASRGRKRECALRIAPGTVTQRGRDVATLETALRHRLGATPRKDVWLYVHGVNTTFHEAAAELAGLWHFLGREGVPVLYSWPSTTEPLAYLLDRESAQFTILHFKQAIRLLAGVDGVEHIHVIAHSTGVEVLSTALRELHLEWGRDPELTRRRLKLGRIVAAAPDIDADVMRSRVIAEGVHLIPQHTTVYASARDRALWLSMWLRGGVPRFGWVEKRRPDARRLVESHVPPRLTMVDATGAETDLIAHSYFLNSPQVSSDIILFLKYGLHPSEHHYLRPLTYNPDHPALWRIFEGYLSDVSDEYVAAMKMFEAEQRSDDAAGLRDERPP